MAKKRRDAIRIAENLVSRGKLEAAVKEYEKVLRADASDTSTLNRVGDLYVRLKRLDKATELFRRAAEHFSREGFYVKAIAIFKKIIRLDPTRIDVYETLADLYHRQGLINEARTQYQVVADYFAQGGDSSKVVSIHERMVSLEPDHPTLRVRLAELYCDVGRMSDAMQQYREIATFMMAHEKVEDAVKVYQGALELDPQDLAYLTDAVLHLKDEGYPEAAQTLLQHAVDRNPKAAKVGVLTGLEERRSGARPAAPPAAEHGDEVVEIPPELEAAEPAAIESEPAAEEAEPAAEETEAADGEAEPVAAEESDEEEAEPVADGEAEPVVAEESDEEEAEPVAGEEEEPVAVEESAEEADESRTEPGAEPGEDASAEPTVFLDLEEASEVPYAVSRDLDESGEIVLDLGELDAEAEAEAEVEVEADAAAESEEEPETDPAVAPSEPAAAIPEAEEPETAEPELVVDPSAARAEELCHEARVLANYGLEDKAVDLLEEALSLAPDHLGARLLAARVNALVGQDARAAELAEGSAGPAEAAGEGPAWTELAEFLSARGFEVAEGRVTAPAVEQEQEPEPELESEVEPEPEIEPAAERDAEIRVEEVEQPAAAAPPEVAPPAKDKRLDWLAESQGADAGDGAEELFGEDEEFFDLAGELEEELRREDILDEEFEPQPAEQSLEEIVEGFRKGVAETLAAEDYDTHYNLGIAYREMGLVDEAIGEFQLAAKDSRYLVDCCSLLGACFLEKGFPDLAVKWYERGLASPNISEKETLGLRYELGNLYVATGENEAAYDTFTEIYGTNSNYRDVVARLAELSGGE